jgi:iron complex outermembrane receptor protein
VRRQLLEPNLKINWLQEGFASFNVNTTLNQKNNVSGFETKLMGIILVNLGLGGTVKVGKQL